jgi:hypothetical protein
MTGWFGPRFFVIPNQVLNLALNQVQGLAISGSSISGSLFLVSNLGLKAPRGSLLMRGYVEIGIHFGLIIFVSFSMYGVLKKDSLPTPYHVLDLTEDGYTLGARMLAKKEG